MGSSPMLGDEAAVDAALMASFRGDGSQEAFARIVERHTNMVHAVCLRILEDAAAAEDAAQATFLLFFRKASSLSTKTVISGWLYRVAVFTARDALKARARRSRHEREMPMPSTECTENWEEARPNLDAALSTLPGRYRDVLVLRYLRGLTYNEVAQQLACSPLTVQRRLNRGVEKLRAVFQSQGIHCASAASLTSWLWSLSSSAAPANLAQTATALCLGTAPPKAAVVTLADSAAKTLALAQAKLWVLFGTLTLVCTASGIALIAQLRTPAPVTAVPNAVARGAVYYAAPDGSAQGNGAADNPWDLATALKQASTVRPGDTLQVRGGHYGNGVDVVATSTLRGTAEAPICIRAQAGQRVVLDGGLRVEGMYTMFQDLEIASTSTHSRHSAQGAGWPGDLQRGLGVSIAGSGIKLTNCTIHDTICGVHVESSAVDVEVTGCIIFNTGYYLNSGLPDGGGVKLSAPQGLSRLCDNIIFNQFGQGIDAFYEAPENQYEFSGNFIFENGAASGRYHTDLFAGGSPKQKIVLRDNVFYKRKGACVALGYDGAQSGSATLIGNFFLSGTPVLHLRGFSTAVVSNNVFVSPAKAGYFIQQDGPWQSFAWSDNDYYGDPTIADWIWENSARTFAQWQALTQFEPGKVYLEQKPATRVILRANPYDQQRAHIAIWNSTLRSSVSVDLSDLKLKRGLRYQVRDAQDLSGDPVLTIDGAARSINLPMNLDKVMQPLGGEKRVPHTPGDFAVFVLSPVP